MIPDEQPEYSGESNLSPKAHSPSASRGQRFRRSPRRSRGQRFAPKSGLTARPPAAKKPDTEEAIEAASELEANHEVEQSAPPAPAEQPPRERERDRDRPRDRDRGRERHQQRRQPPPPPEQPASPASVSLAIEEVKEIVEHLTEALDEMEHVMRTLEDAEVQKFADEREIEQLRRQLRQIHRREPPARQQSQSAPPPSRSDDDEEPEGAPS